MPDQRTHSVRFSYGQLLTDIARIFGRAWPQLAAGVILLGVAPSVVAALPWWGLVGNGSAITVARATLDLIAHAAVAAFVTATALKALSGASWLGAFSPTRLVAGFITSLCLRLFVNWASLVSSMAAAFAPAEDVRLMLMVSVPPSLVVSVAAAGLATPVAVAEQASVASAIAESFRLLHGFRWRIVTLCLAYLALLSVGQAGAMLALSAGRIAYAEPGAGRAVVAMAPLFSGALLDVAFAAFFVQMRRISDARSAARPQRAPV
ncbi:MAG TPA: hypothetical protein VFE13_11235 [Caulobacteraceae bacterium]|nr:hypothetical protein [Caulobacteraceae bacterium]